MHFLHCPENTFERIFVASDIHGNIHKFEQMLSTIEYNPENDLLIILGDLVDRGSNNLDCLKKAMGLSEGGAIVIKGNHDEMLELCLKDILNDTHKFDLVFWANHNGGDRTLQELQSITPEEAKEYYSFLHDLPLGFTIDNLVFVHAGIDPSKSLQKQHKDDLLWIREEFIKSKTIEGSLVIFGHTPTLYMQDTMDISRSTIWHSKDKIGIDCGAAYGGRLACLEIRSMTEYYF